MTEQNQVFDWDSEIEKDDDFIILPPGDYDFTVVGFERMRYAGSDKLPPCPQAKVQLQIETPQGPATVFNNLYLCSSQEGLISSFFSSIGLKKKGEKLQMNWNAVTGCTGRAKIANREYNGNTFNDIKKFYPKDGAQTSAPAAANGDKLW